MSGQAAAEVEELLTAKLLSRCPACKDIPRTHHVSTPDARESVRTVMWVMTTTEEAHRWMIDVLKDADVLQEAGMQGLYNEGVPGMTHEMLMKTVYTIEVGP